MKKRNILILNIIFFTYFIFGVTAFAAEPKEELQQLLEKVHTMQADFTQHVMTSSKKKANMPSASGTMTLERPGKFRWESKGATQQLIIANGKNVYVYDKDLEQVIKRKVDYSDPGNPAMLLSGTSDVLQKAFNIKKTKSDDGEVWFELKPKNKNNMYKAIQLHFSDDELVSMIISDNLGQESEIKFENVVTNSELDVKLFIFSAPKNTDVIEEK